MRSLVLVALAALLLGAPDQAAAQPRGSAPVHAMVSEAELLGHWAGRWRHKASGAVEVVFSRQDGVLLAALHWEAPGQVFDYPRLTPVVRGDSVKLFTAEGTFDLEPPSAGRMNGTIRTFGGDALALELARKSPLQSTGGPRRLRPPSPVRTISTAQ